MADFAEYHAVLSRQPLTMRFVVIANGLMLVEFAVNLPLITRQQRPRKAGIDDPNFDTKYAFLV